MQHFFMQTSPEHVQFSAREHYADSLVANRAKNESKLAFFSRLPASTVVPRKCIEHPRRHCIVPISRLAHSLGYRPHLQGIFSGWFE